MSRATLDKKPHEVASMFDGVSRRYDLTNTLLSLGQDRRWRRQTRRTLDPRPGERVLDLAAGTGVSTAELATTGARAVACDFSLGMLRAGRRRPERSGLPFVAGDALRLPFADGVFDAVCISFGLRNVSDVDVALREMARVTRPGGRLLVCEFSRPTIGAFRFVYLNYLMRALPAIARRVASNPDAYVYLAESIRQWPAQPDLARRIAGNGWTSVSWRNLSGGIVALNRATRATRPSVTAMTMPPVEPEPPAPSPEPAPPEPTPGPIPQPPPPSPSPPSRPGEPTQPPPQPPLPSPMPNPGGAPPLAPPPLPGPLGGSGGPGN